MDQQQLSGSTAGVPLVQTGRRSWVFPDRNVGIVSSRAFLNTASALAATPEGITADVLRKSNLVAFVSGTGAVTVLTPLTGGSQIEST